MRGLLALSALLLAVAAFPSNLTVRLARQAYANKVWPNALIPIGYKSNYPEAWKASVRAGIKVWEARTCVRFRDNDVTSADRVEVYDGGQCSSSVGKEGGKQYFSLGRDCQGLGSAAHELGHAIGLHHMQVRPDRDQYVTVNKANIHPDAFDVNFATDSKTSSLGFPYDYTSVLHYGPFNFAKEGAPGMVPRDSRFRFSMGGIYPSFYDVMRVNKLYNCDAKCISSRTTCTNNGVPDVNNCAQCFCPLGYGGRDCSGVPAGATVLTATAAEQRFETKIGTQNVRKDLDYELKHLVINAPAGKKVFVKVTYFWVSYDITCTYGGIEFYTKMDTRGGAPRVCKMEWLEPSYTSEGSRMFIRMFNRNDQAKFQLTYKAEQRPDSSTLSTMRLILVLALVSFASANIFNDAVHGVKHFFGIADSSEVASAETHGDVAPEATEEVNAPHAVEKRGCGCSQGCKHSEREIKYLPLFFKLHKGECGCKTRRPCGCPRDRPCGCRPQRPRPPRPCHGGCGHHHDHDNHGHGSYGGHGGHGGHGDGHGHGYEHGYDHGYKHRK